MVAGDPTKLNRAERARRMLEGVVGDFSADYDEEVVVAGFRLLGKLGSGGMGSVYHAYQESLDREVAIKVFKPQAEESTILLERLKNEGRLLAQIGHKNVLGIYDAGVCDDGSPYLVLEYAAGGDIGAKLKREGRLSENDAVAVAIDVAKALEAVHKQGIIHRDIKPANVLLATDWTVKLADFGVSKTSVDLTEALTMTGTTYGTLDYMSPEQLDGQGLDERADIYSVGVLIYELLTGVTPRGAYESLGNQSVSKKLARIVTRCMQRNKAQRFSSATELIEALDKCVTSRNFIKPLVITGVCGAIILAIAGISRFLKDKDTTVADARTVEQTQDEQPNNGANRELTGDEKKKQHDLPAATQPTIDSDGFHKLMSVVNTQRDVVSGDWTLSDVDVRSSGQENNERLMIPFEPGESYEILLECTRLSGNGQIAILLPTAAGPIALELDHPEGNLGGVLNLNGQNYREHGRDFTKNLQSGKTFKLRVLVTPQHVSLWIDYHKIQYWKLLDSEASLPERWALPKVKTLGLGTVSSEVSFSNLRYKAVSY